MMDDKFLLNFGAKFINYDVAIATFSTVPRGRLREGTFLIWGGGGGGGGRDFGGEGP